MCVCVCVFGMYTFRINQNSYDVCNELIKILCADRSLQGGELHRAPGPMHCRPGRGRGRGRSPVGRNGRPASVPVADCIEPESPVERHQFQHDGVATLPAAATAAASTGGGLPSRSYFRAPAPAAAECAPLR